MAKPRWRLSGRELLLIFAFWTSLASLTAANRAFDPRGEGLRVIGRTGPLLLPFIEAWLWAAFTPVVFWLSSRTNVSMSRGARIALLVAAGIAIAIFMDVALDFARFELLPMRRRGGATLFFRGFARFGFINQLLVYGAVLAAGLAREYFLRDREQQQERIELEARAAVLEAQLAQARLDALRMQINPHFLFNTLHAVSALVERDPSGVRRMLARLGELMRYTLESRGSEEVPLSQELEFLKRYLDIMEVRFQGKLQVETDVERGALQALVPNFILQPIVENALEHGVSRVTGEARIRIAARRSGEQLVLSVTDRGPGLAGGESSPEGVGLRNTRARLDAMYGGGALIRVEDEPDGGAAAEIRLPWHTANG